MVCLFRSVAKACFTLFLTQLLADLLWRRWTRFLWRSGKILFNIKRHSHHFLQSSDRSLAMTIESCKLHWTALRELHMPRPRYSLHPISVLLIPLHWHTFSAVRGDGGARQRERRVHLRVHRQRGFHRQPAEEESIQEANGPGGDHENCLLLSFL